MSFYKLGIKADLVYALELKNIVTPTPIQVLSIPPILAGKDLIAEAQTGTGKTYAFLLPMFQKMDLQEKRIQALIIAPTRELAIQITEVSKQLSEFKPFGLLAAYGGQDVNAQLHRLKDNIQIIIGTPGRVLDHLRRGSINLSGLDFLVVDEADQMFDIGFMEQLDEIISQLPPKRQTLCFSATISHNIELFTDQYLCDPVLVKAPKKQMTLDNITQLVVETSNRKKIDDFMTILKRDNPTNAIVFCRSRVGTDVLYEAMLAAGYLVEALHGGLSQANRESVMARFRNGEVKYLIATDVAARGLDIDGISHVFNYNLSDDTENYIHRIGRTGRAGNVGVAYTMLTQKDFKRLEDVEAFIGMRIKRIRISEPIEPTPQKKRSGQSTTQGVGQGSRKSHAADNSLAKKTASRPLESSHRAKGSKPKTKRVQGDRR